MQLPPTFRFKGVSGDGFKGVFGGEGTAWEGRAGSQGLPGSQEGSPWQPYQGKTNP